MGEYLGLCNFPRSLHSFFRADYAKRMYANICTQETPPSK